MTTTRIASGTTSSGRPEATDVVPEAGGSALYSFPISGIHPNPYRALDRYPIQREKVDALRESIRSTGWWGNVVARMREDGTPEIAFGHHRLQAAREELGPDASIPLIIRELDNNTMLRMMVRENMQEWGTSASVEQESVRSVVGAFGRGEISLSEPDPKTPKDRLRFAPSFICGGSHHPETNLDHPYTSGTVAEYLGWTPEKVRVTLQALELIEQGVLATADFQGLGSSQARALADEVRKAAGGALGWARTIPDEAEHFYGLAQKLASDTVEIVGQAFRDGRVGIANVRDLVPNPKPTRGLLRIASRERKVSDEVKRQQRSADQRAAENELVGRYIEDVVWFVKSAQEIRQRRRKLSHESLSRIHNVNMQVRSVLLD